MVTAPAANPKASDGGDQGTGSGSLRKQAVPATGHLGHGSSRRCSRCGVPPLWLVAVPLDETKRAGRLLVYCDKCRREMAARLGTVLPLTMLDQNADIILTLLYKCGATASEPVAAAETIRVEVGAWTGAAEAAITRPTSSG